VSVPIELAKAVDVERVIKLEREPSAEPQSRETGNLVAWLIHREGCSIREAVFRVRRYRAQQARERGRI
jgi:hypothetical protein